MAAVTSAQLSRIGQFSSCEVSDALIKLKVPHGGFLPDIDPFSIAPDDKVVGLAYTVKMVETSDTQAPKPDGHFVDLAPSDSVMVISSPRNVKSASLGGLLALGAQKRGVKGAVIDGRFRDLREITKMDFPVFARGHSTLGQSPFTRPSQVQVPLMIEPRDSDSWPSITVNPGDVVVADIDGVVVVRPEQVEDVIKLAQKGQEVDERCRKDIEKGRGVKETFAEHRSH